MCVSRWFGAKPLPENILIYYQVDPKQQTSVSKNALKNAICDVKTILFRPLYVNLFIGCLVCSCWQGWCAEPYALYWSQDTHQGTDTT